MDLAFEIVPVLHTMFGRTQVRVLVPDSPSWLCLHFK